LQGFAVRPLSPSCFARAPLALAPQFTLRFFFGGFAVKPLSPSKLVIPEAEVEECGLSVRYDSGRGA
jgi:hypothetical protein